MDLPARDPCFAKRSNDRLRHTVRAADVHVVIAKVRDVRRERLLRQRVVAQLAPMAGDDVQLRPTLVSDRDEFVAEHDGGVVPGAVDQGDVALVRQAASRTALAAGLCRSRLR